MIICLCFLLSNLIYAWVLNNEMKRYDSLLHSYHSTLIDIAKSGVKPVEMLEPQTEVQAMDSQLEESALQE